MKKKILTIVSVIFLLAMVYLAGHYRVLPAHHVRSALDFVKERLGKTEQEVPRATESVEFLDTHLARLLVKKYRCRSMTETEEGCQPAEI
jgi:hypothetical protein